MDLAVCSCDTYELVLEFLEPLVCGVDRLELRFEDPAVTDLLGVRDPVPQDKRVLEGLPSFVAERDLELLAEPIPGRLA